jgi:hypothetical protein
MSSTAIRMKEKLARLLRIAARPGGHKYVAARSTEILLLLCGFNAEALYQAAGELRLVVLKRIKAEADHTDFLHIGTIGNYAPSPWRGVRLAHVSDPSQACTLHDFNIEIPFEPAGSESTLVIYATAGLLSVWDRIQEDLDRCFAAGWRQILIVLITSGFRPLGFSDHSYILSLLLNNFPRAKYISHLDVVVAPEPSATPLLSLVSAKFRWAFARDTQAAVRQDNCTPDKFSALVIALELKTAGVWDTTQR